MYYKIGYDIEAPTDPVKLLLLVRTLEVGHLTFHIKISAVCKQTAFHFLASPQFSEREQLGHES